MKNFLIRLLVLFIGGFISLSLMAQSQEKTSTSGIKSFISNPPFIKQIEIELSQWQDKTNYYLFRWQTNGFFLQEFKSLAELNNPANVPTYNASGCFNDFYWTYASEMGLSLYQRTPKSIIGEKTNGTYLTCMVAKDLISSVMNMGVPNQDIGTIKWDGDSFKRTNAGGVFWHGQIELGSNLIPSGILLSATILSNGVSYNHQVIYRYEKISEQSRMPDGFVENWLSSKNSYVQMSSCVIHKWEITNSMLDADMFSYSSLVLTNNRLWDYTNGQLLISIEGNTKTLKPVHYVLPGSEDDPYHGVDRRASRFIIVCLFFIINSIVIAMVYWVRKKDRTSK
jgi:hypothetical protein